MEMKNYLIRVNGNEYEVEVEEISNNSGEKKSIVNKQRHQNKKLRSQHKK
jgi:hypothetical protein